ncbi:MAG: phospholipase D-like domain-containing protein [Tepidisphaeraceae bacterium]|jgi:hypothetical protein
MRRSAPHAKFAYRYEKASTNWASMRLLSSPWTSTFDETVRQVTLSLLVSSPYVGMGPATRLTETICSLNRDKAIGVQLLVDLSRDNLVSGATDPEALVHIAEKIPRTTICFLPSVHAKVYVADDAVAVVTSGNLTASGLERNYEYGVVIDNRKVVRQVRRDIMDYAALGVNVSLPEMRELAAISARLRDVYRLSLRSVRRKIAAEFARESKTTDELLVQLRVAGRTPSAVFTQTLLYLLRRGPMATKDLHPLIQQIHPDLCDDSVDRVIAGHHFGKKWKHGVRSAQQRLKEEGRVVYANGLWGLTDPSENGL